MKKNIKKYVVAIVMLIAILPLVLTGCDFTKKAKENSKFPDTLEELAKFGADFKLVSNMDATKTNKIKVEDSAVDAYKAIQANYAEIYDYIAMRGIVSGTTNKVGETDPNSIYNLHQTVYSTLVKERKDHKKDSYTVFHEDAAVANKKTTIPVIVRVLQTTDKGASTYVVKKANHDITSKDEAYPSDLVASYKETAFSDKTTYLASFHQDFDNLLPYVIEATTVDPTSNVTVDANDADLLNINLKFNADTLQDATLERREVVALKTEDSPIKNVKASDVTFTNLTIKVQIVKKTGYIRFIHIDEQYTITTALGVQECDFDSDFYFTHKASELPMALFTPYFAKKA